MDDMSRISTITSEIGKILDSRELENIDKGENLESYNIKLQDVDFSYYGEKKVIDNIGGERSLVFLNTISKWGISKSNYESLFRIIFEKYITKAAK